LKIIVAADKNGVIGKGGTLPWYVTEDLKHFKRTTEGGTVIMGYNTFISLQRRPLPNRINIVIDKNVDFFEHAYGNLFFVETFQVLNGSLGQSILTDNLFIIGGEKTYANAIKLGVVDEIILTRIDLEVEGGDAFFHVPEGWVKLANQKLSDRAVVEYYRKGN
jgi:dihydrofolate reductase